ncbi:hypothetical protein [Vulcanisaeta souniana]|uniref:Uncharacterized protein n=1 Tax=Vulcanisaeta souniana JCM 11219 TaxID=1293586 RepID=A0A830E6A5_9CREN|nr:hypothetical protein [Vulcanisaeta souniana]BDR93066.1 hypothetical protein Vsou_21590 [Vulcanisaeta souniana JCM 11219]GGI87330.1 hypothetical protein GCM10007112_25320 [Vulcanisaeta souniana JCM 11219]
MRDLYYKVKRNHEKVFERIFNETLNFLKENVDGFINAKLYRVSTTLQDA